MVVCECMCTGLCIALHALCRFLCRGRSWGIRNQRGQEPTAGFGVLLTELIKFCRFVGIIFWLWVSLVFLRVCSYMMLSSLCGVWGVVSLIL